MTARMRDELGGQKTRVTRNEWRPKNAQGMDDRTRDGDGLILSRVWLDGQNAPVREYKTFEKQSLNH